MALSDKDIIITPNRGQTADPKIEFRGADGSTSAQTITAKVYPTSGGTLSFEGSVGQLFSITNSLTGTLFAVSNISGNPSIEVLDTGVVKLAQYSGSVSIGTATSTDRLNIGGASNNGITFVGGTNPTITSPNNLLNVATNNIYLRPGAGYAVIIDTANGLAVYGSNNADRITVKNAANYTVGSLFVDSSGLGALYLHNATGTAHSYITQASTVLAGNLTVSGSIKQSPGAGASTALYLKTNGAGTVSSTNLNAGLSLYDDVYVFGMDLGYISGDYTTRFFIPNASVGPYHFSWSTATASPTGQSSFTEIMKLAQNGNLTVSGTTTVGPNGSGNGSLNLVQNAASNEADIYFKTGSTTRWIVGLLADSTTTLNFSNGTSNALSLNASTLAATFGGNLTVNGTGANQIGASGSNLGIGGTGASNVQVHALGTFVAAGSDVWSFHSSGTYRPSSANGTVYGLGSNFTADTTTVNVNAAAGLAVYDVGKTGANTLTNIYGLYIRALTGTATNKYAIYDASGQPSVLSGNLTVSGTIGGGTSLSLTNSSTGTTAQAALNFSNGSYTGRLAINGTNYTNDGVNGANRVELQAPFSLNIVSGQLLFWSNPSGSGETTSGAQRLFAVYGGSSGGRLEHIAQNYSASPYTAAGQVGAYSTWAVATLTDNNTAASGTASSQLFHYFQAPTLAATNTSITTTNAATAYIDGGPIAGSNQTITNSYGLWNAGKTRLDGNVLVGTAINTTKLSIGGTGANLGIYSQPNTTSGSPKGAQIYLGDYNFENSSYYNSASGIGVVYNSNSAVASDLAFYVYGGNQNSRNEAARFVSNTRNFLIGTTTDNGAKLQVTGTISFSGDFYSASAGSTWGADSGATGFQIWGTGGGANANKLVIRTNSTPALTIDSSQNATFAGTVDFASNAWITSGSTGRFYFSGASGDRITYIKGGPADGTGTAVVLRNGADSNIATFAGNGNATFAGNIIFPTDQTAYYIKGSYNGGAIRFRSNSAAATDRDLQFGNVDNAGSWTPYMTVNNNGYILIGTTDATGYGKLQLVTHTDKLGGIGFGTDLAVHRWQAGGFAVDHVGGALPAIGLRTNGTERALFYANGSTNVILGSTTTGASLTLISSNGVTALTLDSSQNATFAGTVSTSGAITESSGTDQALTLNSTDGGWKYIGFSWSGSRRAYFGLDPSGYPIWGSDISGATFQIAGSGTSLLVAGSVTSNKNLDSITTEADYGLRIKNTAEDGGLYLGANSTVSVIQAVDPGNTFDRKLSINPNGGNVGIGTDSPTYKLDVIQTTNDTVIRSKSTTAGAWFYADSATDGYYGMSLLYAGTSRWFIGGYETADFTLKLSTTGTEYFRILRTNGNVGIGTTSPGTKLEVLGDSGLRVTRASNTDQYIAITGGDGGGTASITAAYGLNLNSGTSTFPMTFQIASSEKMRISSGGNVGIGYNAPTQKLHLAGGSFVGLPPVYGYVPTTWQRGSSGIIIAGSQNSDGSGWSYGGRIVSVDEGDGLNIAFDSNYDNSWTNNTFVISGRSGRMGYIGIGTNTPDGKLHIRDTNASAGWQDVKFARSSAWGDGSNTYMTISPVMLTNPHITWTSGNNGATIRMGRSGGVSTGAWYEVGVGASDNFYINREGAGGNFYIDSSARVGLGTTSPLWKLHVNGATATTVVWDVDNTGYYLDPAGDSRLSTLLADRVRVNSNAADLADGSPWYGLGTSTIAGWNGGGSYLTQLASYWGLRLRARSSILDIDGSTGEGTFVFNNAIYAPRYYDYNDSNYYVDPASTSNLNGLTVAGTITGSITGTATYVAGGTLSLLSASAAPRTSTSANTIRLFDNYNYNNADGANPNWPTQYGTVMEIYGRGGHEIDQLHFSADRKIYHRSAFYGESSWTSFQKILEANDATSSNSAGYLVLRDGSGGFSAGSINASGYIYAPRYYDSDNTGYYVDPNGATNLLTLQASYIVGVKPAINTVNNNLGNPTVEEMALIHSEFNNKLRFVPPYLQEQSTNGSTWTTSTRATSDQLADMMIGEGGGVGGGILAIPAPGTGNAGYYRLTWNVASTVGYCYLNSVYFWCSTNGNNVTYTVEARDNGTSNWVSIATGTIANWPGHVYIPHTTLPAGANNSTSGYYDYVRVTFAITSAAAYGTGLALYACEWWGGYPQGRRNVQWYDRSKNVWWPAKVYATQFVDSEDTTYYVDPASTSRVNNLLIDNALTDPSGNGRILLYGNLHIDSFGSYDIYANYYSGKRFRTFYGSNVESFRTDTDGIVYAYSQFRTPKIYDYDNTAYYLDPAGTSNLYYVYANAGLYLNNAWLTFEDDSRNPNDSAHYPNAATRAVRFSFAGHSYTNSGGNYSGIMHFSPWTGTTSSTGDAAYQLAFGSSATNGSGVPQLNIRNGIDTTWNSWYRLPLYGINPSNNTTNTLYTSRLYDTDDTAYYVDPASTSNLYSARFGHANQTDANDGVIGAGIYDSGLNIVGTQTVVGQGRVVRVWGTLMDNSGVQYVSNNSGTWSINISGNSATATKSYSVDVSDAISRNPNNVLPTTSPHKVRYDFISAGTSSNSGGSYAGLMTFAPWEGNTTSTGDASYQMVFGSSSANGSGVPQLNIRNGIDSTWNSWYRLPLYGINPANNSTNTLYTSKLYDTDDTGYYVDPASTSVLNILTVGSATVTSFAGNTTLFSTNVKTSSDVPFTIGTATGGSADFQLIFARSAAGTGSYYSIQAVEQTLGYRDLWLQKNGGNIRIGPDNSDNYVYRVADSQKTILRTSRSDNTQEGLFQSDGWGNFTFNKSIGVGYNIGSAQTGNVYASASVRSPLFYDSDDTDYYLDPAGSSGSSGKLKYSLTVNGSTGGDGYGIALYPAYVGTNTQPVYGIMFATTANYSTHGAVNGDWATYFTMNTDSGRGWIFRQASGNNVASISNTGYASVQSLAVGGTTLGTTGEIRATNNITAYYSDERLKTKLGPIENPIEKVKSLSGFYFAPNDTAMALGYKKTVDVGVSAQEVNAVLPEVIAPAPIDPQYMTVRYEKLIPLLIEAIKAQQTQIEELRAQVSSLMANK